MRTKALLALTLFAGLALSGPWSWADSTTNEPVKRTKEQMAEALRRHFANQTDDRRDYRVEERGGQLWIRKGRSLSRYSSRHLVPGDPAPSLECAGWLNTVDGQAPPQLEGRAIMLDFSATWCGPCVQSMPHVQKLHEQFGGKGLTVVIATDEPKDVFQPFATKNEYTMPVAYGLSRSFIREAYGVTDWPTLLLIDASGRIAYVGDPRDDALELRIQSLVGSTH